MRRYVDTNVCPACLWQIHFLFFWYLKSDLGTQTVGCIYFENNHIIIAFDSHWFFYVNQFDVNHIDVNQLDVHFNLIFNVNHVMWIETLKLMWFLTVVMQYFKSVLCPPTHPPHRFTQILKFPPVFFTV